MLKPIPGEKPPRGCAYNIVHGLSELQDKISEQKQAEALGVETPSSGFYYIQYTGDLLKLLRRHCLSANSLLVFLYYGLYHDQESGRIHKRTFINISDAFNMPISSVYAAVGILADEKDELYNPKKTSGPEGTMPAWAKVNEFIDKRNELKKRVKKIRDDYRARGISEDKIPQSLDRPFDFTTLRKELLEIGGEWDPNAPLDEDMKQALADISDEDE